MSDEDLGSTSAQLHASGAIGHENVSSGAGLPASGGNSMMPFGNEGLSFGHCDIGSIFDSLNKGFEDTFEWMKSGSSALGASITDIVAKISNHLGAAEAQGDQGLDLRKLGQGERAAPPTASEVHAKINGLRGAGSAEM